MANIYFKAARLGARTCPTTHGNTSEMYQPKLLDGTPIGDPTKTPFFSAARTLLRMGYDPEDTLYLCAPNTPNVTIPNGYRMKDRLGSAAEMTVLETDKEHRPVRIVRYVPRPTDICN